MLDHSVDEILYTSEVGRKGRKGKKEGGREGKRARPSFYLSMYVSGLPIDPLTHPPTLPPSLTRAWRKASVTATKWPRRSTLSATHPTFPRARQRSRGGKRLKERKGGREGGREGSREVGSILLTAFPHTHTESSVPSSSWTIPSRTPGRVRGGNI